MAPPFRAEQIGSLLRPAELLAARASSDVSKSYVPVLPEEVKRVTREAITSAVKKQESLSIQPLTSGEYERHIFYGGFFENLQGMKILPELPIPKGFRANLPSVATLQKQGVKTRPGVVATGKIQHVKCVYGEEWEVLRSLMKEEQWRECKLTMPSPTWQHMQLAKGTAYSSAAYTSDETYFEDLAAAYRAEFLSLYNSGLRSIQIDDPNLTFFLDQSFIDGCKQDGIDADSLLSLYISAHNSILASKPENLHVGIHLCRGNMKDSTHVASGSYEGIAKRLFTELEYHTFYLEYDSSRAGDFSPLRHLPIGKNVVIGIVSTKDPALEDINELEKRVWEAADVIAQGQGRSRETVVKEVLGVSPQCGFASMSAGGGVGMTEERMWEKLVLVRDLARKIWGDEAA
ncbi:related to methionine synthase II (cobalamin-independent) [Phialocephala subalpina]|uniref:Related to methionine synthase II (Cobalamin-independent) n=1 Tax=Phialocephala subalpina TaxID=576137 RepID=A0A1L7WPR4_9HELO|nr:related to methionine synthase II (cobalamin-independent) [Phialocephala subalpina]